MDAGGLTMRLFSCRHSSTSGSSSPRLRNSRRARSPAAFRLTTRCKVCRTPRKPSATKNELLSSRFRDGTFANERRSAMHKILDKLKEEFFAILPPTIFFFVALHVVTLIRVLIAKGSHFEPLSTVSIAIASLVLGKAVLIADMLPPINRYTNKPLAYNIACKTAIYLLMATLIHYLERLIDFSRQAGGLAAGNAKLLADIVWPHFWAEEIILLLLILVYCTARELARVIGRE